MRVIVVGLGKMGMIHFANLNVLVPEEKILAVDINPERTNEVKSRFPGITVSNDLGYALSEERRIPHSEIRAAVVAVPTPYHSKVVAELARRAWKSILCEKPLAENRESVAAMREAMGSASIFTGYQFAFSGAVTALKKMMAENGWVMLEGSTRWGKNRVGDPRPSSGSLTGEAVHPLQTLIALARVNQEMRSGSVMASLSRHSLGQTAGPDEERPISSCSLILSILDEGGRVSRLNVESSFLLGKRTREVWLTLGKKDNLLPVAHATLTFDEEVDGKSTDSINVIWLDGRRTFLHGSSNNKVRDELAAFLVAAKGEAADSRLVDLEEAEMLVRLTEAAIESDATRQEQWWFHSNPGQD